MFGLFHSKAKKIEKLNDLIVKLEVLNVKKNQKIVELEEQIVIMEDELLFKQEELEDAATIAEKLISKLSHIKAELAKTTFSI